MPITPTSIRSFYISINIENILYGIELFLYFETIGILLRDTRARKKSKLFYALFSSMVVILITFRIATQALLGQNVWLLNVNYPGGADAYLQDDDGVWYMDLATVAVSLLQLMGDALMIYRCWIIWNSNRVVVLPIVLWLTSLTLAAMAAWIIRSPGRNYTGIGIYLAFAYWSTSVLLTMGLTCMICYRLIRHGRMVQEHLGYEHAAPYFTIVTIIIESVFPCTLFGIAFLISLAVGCPVSKTLSSVYFLMMCISPQMLILCIMAKKARNDDTSHELESAIRFASLGNSGPETWRSHSGGVVVDMQRVLPHV